MKKYDHELIFKKYSSLPDAVKDAMFAESNSDKIRDIGKKHGLLLDKMGILADETGLFMLGLTHPKDFAGEIANALGLPPEKASEIAADVNEQILKPIREDLKKVFQEENVSPTTQPEQKAPKKPSFAQQKSFVSPMIFPGKNAEQQKPAEQRQQMPPAAPAYQGTEKQPETKQEPVEAKQEPANVKTTDPYHEPLE